MSPVTHVLVSWLVAAATVEYRRTRCLVTAAGVVPDIDGPGILVDVATANSSRGGTSWGNDFHHVLGHNLWACLAAMGVCAALSDARRLRCALMAAVSFHLHLLMDLAGSRGPDGFQWPIAYLAPLQTPRLAWSGQWELNAWPNFLVTVTAIAVILIVALRRGYSVVEVLGVRADRAVVERIRFRLGSWPEHGPSGAVMRRALLVLGVFLAAVLLLGGGAKAYVDSRFSNGVLCLKAGNYEAARERLRLLARCGHADSQHVLGQIYAFGWGVLRDDDVAIHWFRRAKKWAEPGASPEAPDARLSLARVAWQDWGLARASKPA